MTVCQMLVCFALVALIDRFFQIELILWLNEHKLYLLIITFAILIANFKYYSKDRVSTAVEKFRRKSKGERILWGIISWLSLLWPLVIMSYLSKK